MNLITSTLNPLKYFEWKHSGIFVRPQIKKNIYIFVVFCKMKKADLS